MNKLIIVLFCLSAGLCYYATRPVDHSNKVPPPASQKQTEKAQNKTEFFPNIISTKSLPKPLLLGYDAYELKKVAQEKTGKKNWILLQNIPKAMPQALISVEDRRFYEHGAIDFNGILRAVLVNLQSDGIVQGASTLTQQLVKNNLLTNEQSIERKFSEAGLAIIVESRHSKDDILEMYLNTTYFGAGATGIKAAANTYFGVEPFQLSLTECATLAGLPNAPTALNPFENPEGCIKRRNLVLTLMGKQGFIREDEVSKAIAAPLVLKKK